MKQIFLLLALLSTLSAYEQVVFVLSPTFTSQKAKLITYEKVNDTFIQKTKAINVNLGKNGLAWGSSQYKSYKKQNQIIKKEGDKKAVAGVFDLSMIYTYENSIDTNMPYTQSTTNHICVDDISSDKYNQIIYTKNKNKYKSYENMLLSNDTYKYVIKVEHNTLNKKSLGSCIFLHVQNPKKIYTSGCTSMLEQNLKDIVSWLDKKKKPILIQIPKSSCTQVQKDFSFIDCSISN